MNDLMTQSFLSYVELKKQAHLDLEQEKDLELGEEQNLSQFFTQVEEIKGEMQEISHLLLDLQSLNDETKSTYSAKILRGLRDRMDSDMVAVLKKTKSVKARLESLDKSNAATGNAVDRTRVSITNGLRSKLKEIMNGFQALREKIMGDYREGLKRRYYNATGEEASEEVIEGLVMQGDAGRREKGLEEEERERHEGVMDIWRSLNRLHQVFLDMAVMVETQGEKIDDIEHNVAVAGSFISGGTNSLLYAKQMKKGGNKCVCWVLAVGFVVLLVCLVAIFTI